MLSGSLFAELCLSLPRIPPRLLFSFCLLTYFGRTAADLTTAGFLTITCGGRLLGALTSKFYESMIMRDPFGFALATCPPGLGPRSYGFGGSSYTDTFRGTDGGLKFLFAILGDILNPPDYPSF